MAESIGTARLDIVVDTSSLDAGVTKAKRSTNDMAKAAQDASQKMDAGTKRQVQALERQIATLGKSRSEVIRWRIEQQTSGRVAAELTAKLEAQQRGLAASAVSMAKFGDNAKRAALGLAAIAIAAGGSLAVSVKNAIDFADHLNDINIRLGISAEALSGWAFAAQQSGTDIDALGLGLQRLAKNMAEALDPKSKQAGLFKALGVEITDARGNLRNLEDVLPDIASKFRDMDNATTEAALAQELLGKSGGNLLEFLNLGGSGIEKFRREAKELGLELSGNTLKAADAFKDEVSKLGTLGQAAGLQLAEKLIPPLTELVKAFQEGIQPGGDVAKVIHWMGNEAEAASADIKQLKSDFSDFGEIFAGIRDQAESTYGVLRNIATLDFGGAKESLADLFGARARTLAAVTQDRFQFANVRSGSGSTEEQEELERKTGGVDPDLARFLGGGKETKRAKTRVEDPAKKALEEARKLATAEKEVQARLDAIDDARFKAIEGWAELTAQLNGPLAEAELDHVKRMAEIQRLGLASGATADQIAAAKAKEALAYQASTDAIREQLDALENPGRVEAMDNLRQIGYDFLVDLPRQGKDAWKNLLDDLERMATQWAAKGIIERLLGKPGTTGSGSNGADWIGMIGNMVWGGSGGPGYAKGGAFFGGSEVTAFANGGIFDRPTMFGMGGGRLGIMGEAGPEAIMPLERGPDNRLGVRMHGGANVQTNNLSQTVVVQGKLDASTLGQMARKSGREAAREIARTGT